MFITYTITASKIQCSSVFLTWTDFHSILKIFQKAYVYMCINIYIYIEKSWRDISKLLTMIKTRKVGFGVILIFLSAISHLFSTMNMYYLPTLKKPLKEKKKNNW